MENVFFQTLSVRQNQTGADIMLYFVPTGPQQDNLQTDL